MAPTAEDAFGRPTRNHTVAVAFGSSDDAVRFFQSAQDSLAFSCLTQLGTALLLARRAGLAN